MKRGSALTIQKYDLKKEFVHTRRSGIPLKRNQLFG